MITKLQTAPTAEPLTLVDAFSQLRLLVPGDAPSAHPDADYVEGLIRAARWQVEAITRRALMTQTWDLLLDRFPAGVEIELPHAPLQSVTYLKYYDTDDTEQTLTEGTEFSIDTASEPGRIVLDYDETWPTDTLRNRTPIEIRFVAGYASAGDIPSPIMHAIKLLVSHWYDNRLPAGAEQTVIIYGVTELLAPYRVWSF